MKQNGRGSRQRDGLSQVKELLIEMLPDVEDIRFTAQNDVRPKLRAEFKTPFGWVPLRQLGYGYQTLITWVADLVARMVDRYPNSKDPLSEPAVVLVDEIDLHLHPQWQRNLMSFLTERFPATQFIATAHSPLVAQAASDANLVVLRREKDHVIIDNDPQNIRGWRVDQILTSDLFGLESARPPQLEKLLNERKLILTKPHLKPADKHRLKQLEAEIGEISHWRDCSGYQNHGGDSQKYRFADEGAWPKKMIHIIKPSAPYSLLKRGKSAVEQLCQIYDSNPEYQQGTKCFEFKGSIYAADEIKESLLIAQHHNFNFKRPKNY